MVPSSEQQRPGFWRRVLQTAPEKLVYDVLKWTLLAFVLYIASWWRLTGQLERIEKAATQLEARITTLQTQVTALQKVNLPQPGSSAPPQAGREKPSRIKFISDVALPDIQGPGWQGAIVRLEPPAPKPLQVWIKQGDHLWYSCPLMTPLSENQWRASCLFGNPASPKQQDWATKGLSSFSLGAFCSDKKYPDALADDVWKAVIAANSTICQPVTRDRVVFNGIEVTPK